MSCNYTISEPYRFYGETVPSDKLLLSHKKILESHLSNYFLKLSKANESFAAQKRAVPFQYQIRSSEALIRIEDGREERIPAQESVRREYAKIARVVRYYQNLGYVKRDLTKDLPLADTSKAVVASMKKSAEPTFQDHGYSTVRIGDNTLSFVKDVLRARSTLGLTNNTVSNSYLNNVGYASGSIWSFFAIKEIYDSAREIDSARAIGDQEGVRRAQARYASGVTTLWGSGFYLTTNLVGSVGADAAAAALGYVSNGLFGVGSLIGMAIAGLGVYRCFTFTSRLDDYLNNQDKSEAERLKGAFRFLKDSMSVTPEERREITERIHRQNKNKTSSEKEILINLELQNLTETKVKYMKRRTSHKSLSILLNNADRILSNLEKGQGIEEAKEIIRTIKSENRKKLSLYMIGFIASVFGLVALVLSTLATGGIAPFVLLGLSALVYIILGGYNLTQNLFYRQTDVQDGVNLQIPAPHR